MGLAQQLDYRYPEPNRFQRLAQAVGSSVVGARLFSRLQHHIDRVVSNLSGGKTTASEALAGMPVLDLTTTGAKSGQLRTTPLLGIPCGEHLAVIGSGWGQAPTPGWVYNLRANPDAVAAHGHREVSVKAREVDGDGLDEIWATARSIYDGYAKYPERASHREIVVFVLEAR